jgi:putative endonuclease
MNKWHVYVAKCSDNSLYCGITTDVDRRIYEHNFSKKAAKYTRSRRPVKLIFKSASMSRSSAASVEAKFKKLRTDKKKKIVNDLKSFNDYFNIES